MNQRLLLLLFLVGLTAARSFGQNIMSPTDSCYAYDPTALAGTSANPNLPVTNQIARWIHDPTQNGENRADPIGSYGFNQNTFKCYIINGIAFRIRFPNNYNPNNPTKYPVIVFVHGAGEAAFTTQPHNLAPNGKDTINRENQDQLYWGAQLFEQRMNQGEWNGFLLFPQIMSNSAQWDNSKFPDVNRILDTLKKYNNADEDRVISMGLSAGGFGAVNYANLYPKRIAAAVSANPRFIETLSNADSVKHFLQIPIWMAEGGIDVSPDPSTCFTFRDAMAAQGGNIYNTYYATGGHISWVGQWATTDIYNNLLLTKYWNTAHKAQPVVYFQDTAFCAGQTHSAQIAVTGGYYSYEWQYDGGGGFSTIGGATSNVYTASLPGKYRVHFKRYDTSAYSAWTPYPIVITSKVCTTDTAFVEHFESTPIHNYVAFSAGIPGSNSAYYNNNLTCQDGIFPNSTETFTQDATGRVGGRFMLNYTMPDNCQYFAGDQVWRVYPVTVTPNTNYTLSFYMGNLDNSAPLARITAKMNGAVLSPTGDTTSLPGDIGWRKYSFNWNSGSTNTAEIDLLDSTTDANGNNFVIDEISLVKYKAPPTPGGAIKNVDLWVKANTLPGGDSSLVGLWPNNEVNGNNLTQFYSGLRPLLKNNANDNINFNPVVLSNNTANRLVSAIGGFTGTKVHNAVYAYFVISMNSLAKGGPGGSDNTWLSESVADNGNNSNLNIKAFTGGGLQWWAGDASGIIYTPNNVVDLNKPTVWSFSKNNIYNTGSGNKQDVRKNGVIISSNNVVSSFTGNNGTLNLGPLDGTVAEVIYILDSTITAKKQNTIESYLALKYGTSLGTPAAPQNYTASDSSTVFWTANATYQNDVFGIGKDSTSALLQTISNSVNSGSGNGTGQSGKGNLVLSTSATLLDKQFLTMGNDAGSLTQHQITSTSEAPASLLNSYRIGRKWKVINTASGGNSVGGVTLSFDTTGLGNQQGGAVPGNYALMIDLDGDGNFATGSLNIFTATGAAGKKINFAGVTLPNNVVFTIITFRATALPAVWLGFTADAVNGNALLDWKTGDEINVATYTVEHSFNGISFSAVGTVAANNNTGTNEYTLTDPNLAAGVHYYRIRRTDLDGRIEYSDTHTVKISVSGANVVVRPNPVTSSTLTLTIAVQQNTKTMLQVMSVDGKLLVQQNINLASGSNTVNVNISNVPSGVYLVQVKLSDELVTKKFIKQP